MRLIFFSYYNNCVINILVYLLVSSAGLPLNYIPWNERGIQTKRNYTKLHSHQLNMRISFAFRSHPYFVLSTSLFIFADGGCKMVAYKILICIFLITNGGWASFHIFTNVCFFSSVKSLSMYFIHHSIWLSCAYWLVCYFFWEQSFVRWAYYTYLPKIGAFHLHLNDNFLFFLLRSCLQIIKCTYFKCTV